MPKPRLMIYYVGCSEPSMFYGQDATNIADILWNMCFDNEHSYKFLHAELENGTNIVINIENISEYSLTKK